MNHDELYSHFYQAFNQKSDRVKKHTRQAWNDKADRWKKELADPDSSMNQLTSHRISHSIDILSRHQILGPDKTLLDIGCGPGRFVAGFAPYVKHACGSDISDQMISAGSDYCKKAGLNNTSFLLMDFKEVDPDKSGLRKAFDICFSFMSPAVSKYDTLHKMMSISRQWCSSSFVLSYQSRLDQEILSFLKPDSKSLRREDQWFYNMFNLLWLEGYQPLTDYYDIEARESVKIDQDLIRFRIRRKIKDYQPSDQEIRDLEANLLSKAKGGYYPEITNNRYGMLLWKV